MFVTYAPVSTSSGLFFIRKCFVGFILSSTALCSASPWFFHRKPFVLSKQALICASHSKLQQGCQVSIPTPARSSCSSGPEQQAGAVCAVLLPYGPLVQQVRGRSHEHKCLPCWLEVLKAAACWLMITCIMTPHTQMLPGMRKSGSSPCHPLLVGRILIFQQADNKDSKSQKVSDPTMPIITPANVNTQEGEGRAWCTH